MKELSDAGWLEGGLGHTVTSRVPVRRNVESCVGNTGYMYHCPVCNTLVGMRTSAEVISIFDAKTCAGCGCELNWDDAE